MGNATDYTETYTCSWAYPYYDHFKNHAMKHVDQTGLSPVTAGGAHGGGDVYMAACSYIYYRIYLITGDEHYLKFDKFLEKNSRTPVDLNNEYGYGRAGYTDEYAGGFAYNIHMGTYAWLPWCSYVMVDPLSRMMDTFGVYSVADAEKLPLEERLERNKIYKDYEFYGK